VRYRSGRFYLTGTALVLLWPVAVVALLVAAVVQVLVGTVRVVYHALKALASALVEVSELIARSF